MSFVELGTYQRTNKKAKRSFELLFVTSETKLGLQKDTAIPACITQPAFTNFKFLFILKKPKTNNYETCSTDSLKCDTAESWRITEDYLRTRQESLWKFKLELDACCHFAE